MFRDACHGGSLIAGSQCCLSYLSDPGPRVVSPQPEAPPPGCCPVDKGRTVNISALTLKNQPTMAPCLARSAPSDLNHWWNHLRFRLQNKKGWTEMLDETFLLCTKQTNNIPLFFAAKKNSAGCVKKLLGCASTNIFERGALGETALHIAVMNDNVDAAVALMDGAPELSNEPMTSELMQGVTPLQIAVVNQNITLVGQLIARGGDAATPRVTGLYFKKRPGGLVYYGEHILSFAACMGNECIMTMLMDAGA
ncbi:unnamed protein product, partial [Gadus morhua 'NCC']